MTESSAGPCPRSKLFLPHTAQVNSIRIARLKRAARKTPLVLSGVSRQGVPEVLRALFGVIEGVRSEEAPQPAEVEGWRP